jgi:thiol-disulfide isomerase/thioredoxin
MQLMSRRLVLAAAGTLATAAVARKPRAEDAGRSELGNLSALKPTNPPKPLPEITFVDADGVEHHLEEFRGHGMVVNLWATWCVPCVAEMPALAALEKTLAPADIAVLPLSSDRGGAAAVRKFYQAHEIGSLPVLLDPKGAAARAWGVRGIPTTIIVDKQGRECARLEGAADWATAAAAAKVKALIGA